MTRGKPCSEQLDLGGGGHAHVRSMGRVSSPPTAPTRGNYGGLGGPRRARQLFAPMLASRGNRRDHRPRQCQPDSDVRHGGHGDAARGARGRQALEPPPAPSNSSAPCRDTTAIFSICEEFGIEMVTVGGGTMDHEGPEMNRVEEILAGGGTPRIRPMWLRPMYSNPTGITYSDGVVDRLARLKAKAPTSGICGTMPTACTTLSGRPDRLKDLLAACKAAGHADRPLIFGSTSQDQFRGRRRRDGGRQPRECRLAVEAHGDPEHRTRQVNQLRHVRYLRDAAGHPGAHGETRADP